MVAFAFTAIDFETTGSVPGFPNEPWQIGLYRVDGVATEPKLLDSYLRISPSRPFNKYAPGRHAQLRAILAQAPTMLEMWQEVSPLLMGSAIVAHNIGTERTILRSIAPLHIFEPWIDTLALARKVWPGLDSYALEDLVPLLGLDRAVRELLPGREPHDALYDAVACAKLLELIASLPGWSSMDATTLSRISQNKR